MAGPDRACRQPETFHVARRVGGIGPKTHSIAFRTDQPEGTGTKEPERRNRNKERGTLAPGAAPAAV